MQPVHQPQNILHFLINQLFCDLAAFYCFFQRLCHAVLIKIIGNGHFQIQSACGCLFGQMDAAPVRNCHAVKFPFFTKNMIQQSLTLAAVFPVIAVISTHQRINMPFLHHFLKGWKINLMKCSLTDFYLYPETLCLLVVQRKMLHAGCSICTLHALHQRHGHFSGKIRIFTHIFEISSAKGTSLDVHTWCKNHIFSTAACFLAQNCSGFIGKIPVPGCCQGAVARQIGNIIIGIADYHPVGILEIVAHAHWAVRHYQFRDSKALYASVVKQASSMDHADFLLQGQPGN